MSFGKSLPATAKDEVEGKLNTLTPDYPLNDEAYALFEAATEAAKSLVAALPADSEQTHVTVSIHGHGHHAGDADTPFNTVSVSVNEASAPAPAEPTTATEEQTG